MTASQPPQPLRRHDSTPIAIGSFETPKPLSRAKTISHTGGGGGVQQTPVARLMMSSTPQMSAPPSSARRSVLGENHDVTNLSQPQPSPLAHSKSLPPQTPLGASTRTNGGLNQAASGMKPLHPSSMNASAVVHRPSIRGVGIDRFQNRVGPPAAATTVSTTSAAPPATTIPSRIHTMAPSTPAATQTSVMNTPQPHARPQPQPQSQPPSQPLSMFDKFANFVTAAPAATPMRGVTPSKAVARG